jgi:uncharacterized protein (UPF0332 family)
MAVTPVEILEMAGKLHSGAAIPSVEARHRTVAGRAYYSAYHETLATLGAIKGDSSYRLRHSTLVKLLVDHREASVRHVGQMMKTLKKKRGLADYRLKEALSPDEARVLLLTAKNVIERQGVLKEHVKVPEIPPASAAED